jgi:hypothetical protein
VDLALEEPELSPRELAVRVTDTQRNYVSEAGVYRFLNGGAARGARSRAVDSPPPAP